MSAREDASLTRSIDVLHLHKQILESIVVKIDKGSNQGSRDGCYGVRIVLYVDSVNYSL